MPCIVREMTDDNLRQRSEILPSEKDKTPQQMKNQIIKLLEDWAQKEKAIAPPEKKADKNR
jgi:hypothetical protein